jgi:hypothetical protein
MMQSSARLAANFELQAASSLGAQVVLSINQIKLKQKAPAIN